MASCAFFMRLNRFQARVIGMERICRIEIYLV